MRSNSDETAVTFLSEYKRNRGGSAAPIAHQFSIPTLPLHIKWLQGISLREHDSAPVKILKKLKSHFFYQ